MRAPGSPANDSLAALSGALEAAGIEFIDENGGGPRVRFRQRQGKIRGHKS